MNNLLKIIHRVNSSSNLLSVPKRFGIEVDIRNYGKKLILHHEPFADGELFDEFLKNYNHRLIILNVKSEGIEEKVLQFIKKYNIKDYFFLDITFPVLIKLVKQGENNIAVRFSEYESIESCLLLKNKVKWVWIDCFNKLPLDEKVYKKLSAYFKICLVSPELQGHPLSEIKKYKEKIHPFHIDAVCTDRADLWD